MVSTTTVSATRVDTSVESVTVIGASFATGVHAASPTSNTKSTVFIVGGFG